MQKVLQKKGFSWTKLKRENFMNKLSLSCQQVVMINLGAIKSHKKKPKWCINITSRHSDCFKILTEKPFDC